MNETEMADTSTRPPRLLIVEEDAALREFLAALLQGARFDVAAATTGEEALRLLATHPADLLLVDLGRPQPSDPFAAARPLRERAAPRPVGLLTTGAVAAEDARRAGFAFLLPMPFDIDALLLRLAVSLARPLSPLQQRQAQVVRHYFAALGVRDWDALVALCTEDVAYVLPPPAPFAATVRGSAAFRAYTLRTYAHFPLVQFTDVRVAALPAGLVGRYRGWWRTAEGISGQQEGAIVFAFRGERIAQIGVHLDAQRLRALLAHRAG